MSAGHQVIAAAFLFVLGAALGSFLNVCAYRIPRSMSLLRPASRCPTCGSGIAPRDNLPVLGWILLRGRCRTCASAISPRYPAVEAAVGVLLVCSFLAAGPADPLEGGLIPCAWLIVRGLAVSAFLVTGSLMALDGQTVPGRIAVAGGVAALVLAALRPEGLGDPEPLGLRLLDPALGLLIAGGAVGIASSFGPDRAPIVGSGEVPLAAMIGAFIGLRALVPVLAIALLVRLLLATARWPGRTGPPPGTGSGPPRLGPTMGLASLLPVLAGPWLGPF